MCKAVFWDLQGTLGGDAVADIDRFEPFDFSKSALRLMKENGFFNIVITNQSKIGKGMITLEDYNRTAERIIAYFNGEEILIDDFLCCPHTSNDNCNCKKPKIALITLSAEKFSLDISKCFVIGDIAKNEIVMAHNAGCKGILVLTGGGRDSLGRFRDTWKDLEADLITENALTAAEAIINGNV